MNRRGFTLLEVMVATLIMGIAVVGLMSGISQSLRNADRVIDYDRAALLARSKMDELLLNYQLPKGTVISGEFDPVLLGGKEGGWRAKITPFERQPKSTPGSRIPGADRARDLVEEGARPAQIQPGGFSYEYREAG